VRVAQSGPGNGWGTYFWPRVNDEVVVQFLNGDPDNPVVTGSVYNGMNTPKYALPDNSTRSGNCDSQQQRRRRRPMRMSCALKTRREASRSFFMPRRIWMFRIENDRAASVGNNDSLIVNRQSDRADRRNFNRKSKSNAVEKIGGNSDLGIGGNLTESVGGITR
jgi:type VI secretion system secreted protein VgrG